MLRLRETDKEIPPYNYPYKRFKQQRKGNNMLYNDILKVTEEDIEDGQVENPNCCAIALAVKRNVICKLDEADDLEPYVDGDGYISIREKGTENDKYCLETSKDDCYVINNFISEFDNEEEVYPFKFNFSLEESNYFKKLTKLNKKLTNLKQKGK